MKKLILSFMLALATHLSFGQLDSYGFKGGVNLSSLSTNASIINSSSQYHTTTTSYETDNVFGFYLGVYAEKEFSRKGAFVGEAIISMQGAKLETKLETKVSGTLGSYYYSDKMTTVSTDMKIVQLNIPVYYKYLLTEKLSIHGGGYLGLILSSKNSSGSASVEFDNNTFDLGLLAGLSYAITEQISAEARYNFGILKLDDYYHFKNRVLQVGISYKF